MTNKNPNSGPAPEDADPLSATAMFLKAFEPDNQSAKKASEPFAPGPGPQAPPPGPVEPLPQAPVTLVFKDGHSLQVRNYAVTKTTLYVLDDAASGRRPEISLDQIDVSATERANRAAGVDFDVPAGIN